MILKPIHRYGVIHIIPFAYFVNMLHIISTRSLKNDILHYLIKVLASRKFVI